MTDDRQPRKRRRRRRRGGAPGAPNGDNVNGNQAVPNGNVSQQAGDRGFGTGRRPRSRHRKRSGPRGSLPSELSGGGRGSGADMAPGQSIPREGGLHGKPNGA